MKQPLNEIQRMQQLAGLNEWKIKASTPIFKKGDIFRDKNDNSINMVIIGDPVKGYDEAKEKTEEDVFTVYIGWVNSEDSEEIRNEEILERKGYFYPIKLAKYKNVSEEEQEWIEGDYASGAYIVSVHLPELGLHQD